MTPLMIVYALLAAAGLVLPWHYNLALLHETGSLSLSTFLAGAFANPAAASISVDLAIGGSAAILALVVEARRIGMRYAWVYVLLTFTVAFAFAVPLFLLMRERHLTRRG